MSEVQILSPRPPFLDTYANSVYFGNQHSSLPECLFIPHTKSLGRTTVKVFLDFLNGFEPSGNLRSYRLGWLGGLMGVA